MKTSELKDAALDWAVAKALDTQNKPLDWVPPAYSSDWAQGGPIIEREGIRLHRGIVGSWWAATEADQYRPVSGPTLLVAAMRCFVASKLGDEIEVPEELL